jgi:hypothetical protein
VSREKKKGDGMKNAKNAKNAKKKKNLLGTCDDDVM